jgi:hypothetical protein
MKIGRPTKTEAAPYFFRYIDQVTEDDPIRVMQQQYETALARLPHISEAESLYRYSKDKWSIRGVLSHINDGERLFSFRAFWFARGFKDPLPSFDEVAAAANAESDRVAWAAHLDEFRHIRRSTLCLFENLPPAAWGRSGVASGHVFTVRALAFLIAGHFAHHLSILENRYLNERTPAPDSSVSRSGPATS